MANAIVSYPARGQAPEIYASLLIGHLYGNNYQQPAKAKFLKAGFIYYLASAFIF